MSCATGRNRSTLGFGREPHLFPIENKTFYEKYEKYKYEILKINKNSFGFEKEKEFLVKIFHFFSIPGKLVVNKFFYVDVL